jgi:ATP-dependent DNA helicase HFM1/MER3
VAQAAEYKEIRLRANEKTLFKILNSSHSIRFQLSVPPSTPAHKVTLILQSILGDVEPAWGGEQQVSKTQFTTDVNLVKRHAHRLIRCVIDYKLSQGDAAGARHALLIERSLSAEAWDDLPVHMKQISGIGPAAVRKFVQNGIRSIEDMESTEAHRLETILGRLPPYGFRLLDQLKSFPKLRVSANIQPTAVSLLVQV